MNKEHGIIIKVVNIINETDIHQVLKHILN